MASITLFRDRAQATSPLPRLASKYDVNLAGLTCPVTKQRGLSQPYDGTVSHAHAVFREVLTQGIQSRIEGKFPRIRAHIDRGVAGHDRTAALKGEVNEFGVVSAGLEFPRPMSAHPRRLRPPPKKPETQPLVVVVVRDAAVGRRGEKQAEWAMSPALHLMMYPL